MERYHKQIPERSFGRWISMLHRFSVRYIAGRLKHLGIGRGHLFFLSELYDKEGMSQEELAESLNIDKGTTARALSAMETNGYIRRVGDSKDKRINRIELTQKARSIEREFIQAFTDWTEILTRQFTPAEKRQAMYLLYRMAANAEAEHNESSGNNGGGFSDSTATGKTIN